MLFTTRLATKNLLSATHPGIKALITRGKYDKIPPKGRDGVEENRNTEPLASEMYKDLQKHDAFKMKVIKWLVVALVFSIVGNVGQSIYHDWKWSMFDTFVVDSGDGSGNANLVQGDVGGDILNGENNGKDQEGREVQGNPDQAQGG